MYIVIAGAGLVGRRLAKQLVDAGHDVVVIEREQKVCEYIASRIGAVSLNGNATSIDMLDQAGIEKADVAVATLRRDADNLAYALLASSFDVPRIIVRMRNRRYEAAYEKAGVTSMIHTADVFVNQLLLEVEEPHLRTVATFGPGEASIVVDTVPENALAAGMNVSQIAANEGFPAECVITGIYRPEEKEFVIPRGSATVEGNDRVFLVATRSNLKQASKFLHRTK